MRGGAAESGLTHNRLNMSCQTAKMTGSSKAATNNDNDNSSMGRASWEVVRLRAGLRTTTLGQVGQVRCVASIGQ